MFLPGIYEHVDLTQPGALELGLPSKPARPNDLGLVYSSCPRPERSEVQSTSSPFNTQNLLKSRVATGTNKVQCRLRYAKASQPDTENELDNQNVDIRTPTDPLPPTRDEPSNDTASRLMFGKEPSDN